MNGLKSKLKDRITELERELASLDGVLLGQGYVVVMPSGDAVKVDAENKCQPAHSPGSATWFTREDAQKLGNHLGGGKAVHVRDAIKHDLEVCRKLLGEA